MSTRSRPRPGTAQRSRPGTGPRARSGRGPTGPPRGPKFSVLAPPSRGRARLSRRHVVVRAGRSGSGPPDAVAAPPVSPVGERAALLLGEGGQAPPGGAGLEEEPRSGTVPGPVPGPEPSPAPSARPARRVVVAARAPALAGLLGPREKQEVLLPRAAAVASARDAVRQSRARRAAARAAEPRAAPSVDVVRAVEPPGRAVSGDEGATRMTAAAPPSRPSRSVSASVASRGRRSLGLAIRERLPLWVQLRCGVEFKTLLALVVVLLVAVGFAVHHFWTGRPEAVRAPRVSGAPAEQAPPDTGAAGRTARGAVPTGAWQAAGGGRRREGP